ASLSLAAALVVTTGHHGTDRKAPNRAQFRALDAATLQALPQGPDIGHHEFYFTRAIYSSGMSGYRGWGQSWTTDYPTADIQFLEVLHRLAKNIDSYGREHPVRLDDPELRKFPYLYAVEVGHMGLTDSEVTGLRNYL